MPKDKQKNAGSQDAQKIKKLREGRKHIVTPEQDTENPVRPSKRNDQSDETDDNTNKK